MRLVEDAGVEPAVGTLDAKTFDAGTTMYGNSHGSRPATGLGNQTVGCSLRRRLDYFPASLFRPPRRRVHPREHLLHRIDPREVARRVVIAAALVGGQAKAASGVGVTRGGAA